MDELQRTPQVAKQMAKHGAGAALTTGIRRFEKRVFKPWWTRDGKRLEAENYSIRLAHGGRRETVGLLTPDIREAARRAARFHLVLKTQGWDAAHGDLSPEQARTIANKASPTVGGLIEAAQAVAVHIRPVTLRQYASSLRWLAAEIGGIDANPARFGQAGAAAWRQAVDALSLAALTPRAIETAIAGYVKRRGATPESRRTAQAYARQARGLFSRSLLRLLPFEIVSPFAAVRIEAPRPPKYMARFDSTTLAMSARRDLRDADPECWKAFLLLLGAGLRKGEVDLLTWSNVDTSRGVVRVTSGKTVDSAAEVPIANETAGELERARAAAAGLFVLEGHPVAEGNLRVYRAEDTFERLATWLRSHGVTDRKPLHALRKEAGSLVNAAGGIHAASRFLRHGDIGVTAQHYADARTRVVVGVFDGGAKAEGGR